MASLGSGLSIGTLFVEIAANVDSATKTLQDFTNDVGKKIDQQKKDWDGLSNIADTFTSFGKTMTAAITVPLVGLGAAALNTGRDFESSFNKISAYGDVTGKDLEKLQAQALQLGKDTAFSAQQAADGMAVFASAGLSAEDIYAAMPGTLDLAAAGQMKVADAAVITKDILGQFGLAATDATHVADVLAKTSADTSATMMDMATTLRYVGPQAHAMGLSIEDVSAAIMELDAAGLRGEQAGTGLRGMLASLVAPSTDAAKALEDLKVKISNPDGTIKPFSDIIQQLKVGMDNLHNPTKAASDLIDIFGRESSTVAQILIKDGGPALAAYATKLGDANGAADAMAKKLNQGLNYALDQLGGSVETAGIALSKVLIPYAKSALDTLTKLVNDVVLPAVDAFQKWPTPLQDAALGLAAVFAAAGPLLYIGGQLAGAFVNIASSVKIATGLFSTMTETIKTVQFAIANDLTGALIGGEAKFASLIGTVTRFGPALGIAGIALAGFATAFVIAQSKMEDNQKALDRYISDARMKAIRKAFADGMDIEAITKKFGVDLATVKDAMGITDDAAKAAKAMVAKLGVELVDTGKDAKTSGKGVDNFTTAAADAKKKTDALADAVAKAKANLQQAEDMAKRSANGWDGVSVASKALDTAIKAQDADFLKHNKTLVSTTGSALDFGKAVQAALIPALDDATRADVENEQVLQAVNAALLQNMTDTYNAGQANAHFAVVINALLDPAAQAKAALEALGITSDATAAKNVKSAQDSYDAIVKYYGASSNEATAAWQKMIDAQVAAGGALTADQQITYARMNQAQVDYVNTAVKGWAILWQSLHDNTMDAMHQINVAIFTGDWAGAKDKILDDLQNMGIAVLDKFVKPAEDAIANFVANTLTTLLSGKGLQGVIDQINALGTAISKVGSPGTVTTPPFNPNAPAQTPGGGTSTGGGGTSTGGADASGGMAACCCDSGSGIGAGDVIGAIGGVGEAVGGVAKAAGSAASAASSAVSGIMSGITSVLNPISMVANVVSAVTGVLGLFGVGKGGEQDRLNNIANDTRFLAWTFDTGGARIALLDIRNTLVNFVTPQIEATRWAVDNMNRNLDAVVTGERSVSMNLYGTDPQTVAAYIGTQLRLQGASA